MNWYFIAQLFTLPLLFSSEANEVKTWEIKIPGFSVTEMTEVCFGPYKMPCPPGGCAIIGFEGKPSPFVHHMIVRAHEGPLPFSGEPRLYDNNRECLMDEDADFCFAWAMHGGQTSEYNWDLPENYAYYVGNQKGNFIFCL